MKTKSGLIEIGWKSDSNCKVVLMETLKVEQEEELYNAFVENKAIHASPCSVYFGPCGMASPRLVP